LQRRHDGSARTNQGIFPQRDGDLIDDGPVNNKVTELTPICSPLAKAADFAPNNGCMENQVNGAAPEPNPTARRRAVRRLGRAELVYATVLVVFAVLALLAHTNPYFSFDLSVEHAVQKMSSPWLTAVMSATSLGGNYATPYILTAIAVLAFWFGGWRSEAVGLAVSATGGGLINRTIKMFIARPRPVSSLVDVLDADRSGASFPSGHVAFYVSFFGFLFFVAYALLPKGSWIRRIALVATAIPVLTVGLSRVYLGAHWPSDTIGGYLWSGVWLAIVLHLYRHWKVNATFHRKKPSV
jgi:undecaprenyl-diphosphatase